MGFPTYQSGNIDNKNVTLYKDTLSKYNIVEKLLKTINGENINVIDYGCVNGLLGIKIKKEYDNVNMVLCTSEDDEINASMENIKKSGLELSIKKLYLSPKTLTDEKYDITLFFAIVHHLLHQTKSKEFLLNMLVKNTKKYSIIEVPLKEDTHFNAYAKSCPEEFKIFETIDNVKEFLSSKFIILYIDKVNYPQYGNKYCRYAFTCKLKHIH